MNQLQLNLELEKSYEHQYKGFTLVTSKSQSKCRRIRSRSTTLYNTQYWDEFIEFSYWEVRIYKAGSRFSGSLIVGEYSDCLNEDDAVLVTKTWLG